MHIGQPSSFKTAEMNSTKINIRLCSGRISLPNLSLAFNFQLLSELLMEI